MKYILIRKQHQSVKCGLLDVFKYALCSTSPCLRDAFVWNMQVAIASRFQRGDCSVPSFVISGILKAHWAIIKRITKTHYTAFSEVSQPFTNTCFSKHRMRAKFLSGVFKRNAYRAFSDNEECTSRSNAA